MGTLDDDRGVIRITVVISLLSLDSARTLAEVKKSKLPDALAVVTVNPATAGPA